MKYPVFIKVYGKEVDVPVIIFEGESLKRYAKIFEAIGYPGDKTFTVAPDNREEAIEALIGHYFLFYCNKWRPSNEFIDTHPEFIFVSSGHKIHCEEGQKNRKYIPLDTDIAKGLRELAEFTGITAIRGLVYDPEQDLFVNQGKINEEVQHTTKDLATRFAQECIKWVAAGRKLRSLEVIKELYHSCCLQCAEYRPKKDNGGSCQLCGCNINLNKTFMNKLAMSTTNCPASPPKWTAEVSVDVSSIQNKQAELYQQFLETQKEYGPQTGQYCNCD